MFSVQGPPSRLALCLLAVLCLFACPRIGAAAGTWSVIATGGAALGQVIHPSALAVDTAGNLYVAEYYPNRVQEYTPHP
jgi:hypothetical protein